MTIEKALEVIKTATAQVSLNLQAHMTILEAIRTIESKLKPEVEK